MYRVVQFFSAAVGTDVTELRYLVSSLVPVFARLVAEEGEASAVRCARRGACPIGGAMGADCRFCARQVLHGYGIECSQRFSFCGSGCTTMTRSSAPTVQCLPQPRASGAPHRRSAPSRAWQRTRGKSRRYWLLHSLCRYQLPWSCRMSPSTSLWRRSSRRTTRRTRTSSSSPGTGLASAARGAPHGAWRYVVLAP